MGWIATVALALSLGNASQATTLHVEPQAFSPRAGSLTIESQLDTTMLVGVRLATGSGRILGWVVTPARRRALSVTWDGTLEGRELPQGYYQAQLVSGTLVVGTAPFRIDVTAPRLAQLRAENGGRPFAGDTRLLTTISPNGTACATRPTSSSCSTSRPT